MTSTTPDLRTQAQALQNRGRLGIVFAASTRNAHQLEFWKGYTEAASNLMSGTGSLAAAKDAELPKYDAQTSLQAAVARLPERTKHLTLVQVRQILAANGIDVTSDAVAHRDISTGEVLEHRVLTRVGAQDEHPIARVHMRDDSDSHGRCSPVISNASLGDPPNSPMGAAQGGAA